MFIGHFGVAYFVKKKQPDIPLWLLFISVFLLDFIGSIFFLSGIESATLNSTFGTNIFLQIKANIQYSHSLMGSMIISIICFIIFWKVKKRNWAWIIPLCIISHWLLDLIVHISDLTIFFNNNIRLGFGLYRHLILEYIFEILLLVSGWLFLGNKNTISVITIAIMVALFSMTIFAKQPEFIQKHFFTFMSIMVFLSGLLFIFLANLWEKRIIKMN